jgi:hypothetical protein
MTTEGMRCDGPYIGIQNGLTCLKLRGSNVSIVHCLCISWFDLSGPKDQKKNHDDDDDDNNSNHDVGSPLSSSLVAVDCCNPTCTVNNNNNNIDGDHLYDFIQNIDTIPNNTVMTFHCSKNCILPRQQQHNSNGGGGGAEDGCTATAPNHNDTDNTSSMSIIIRRKCSRNVRLSKNWGVCGYDIFVHPDHCKLLFHSLIIHGGACPMDPYHVIVVVVRTTGLVKSRCKLYHTTRRSRKIVRRMLYLLVLRCSPCYMFYGCGQ